MIDASVNLYNALPRALGTARLPASRSLSQPDETASGGNSLTQVASSLRPDTAISNFAPPPPESQGFASLSPVLASLRLSPDQLNPVDENSKPAWQQLLETQEEITEARRAAAEKAEAREQTRRQAAAEREALQQTIQELQEEVVFSSERQPLTDARQQNADLLQPDEDSGVKLPGRQQPETEPAPILGENNQEPATQPAAGSDRIYPPDTEFPRITSASLPREPKPVINEDLANEQRRVAQLFNANTNTENTGTTINLFA